MDFIEKCILGFEKGLSFSAMDEEGQHQSLIAN
jgi:hypothetical protein